MESDRVAVIAAEPSTLDFESIFHRHYAKVARLIARVLKDTARAEELSVDVFLKLSRTPAAQGATMSGWLHKTAVRLALDELRKQCRREKYERLFSLSRARVTAPLEATTEKQRQVRTVLAVIERRSAELLVLQTEGFSYDEMGDALGINRVSVGTMLARAQQIFRKEYIKRYGKPE
jgi:RNA polymerase sigma-70 factor, ECF subfamily